MDYLFSAEKQAFFVDDVAGQKFPVDVVQIDDATHSTMLAALNSGKSVSLVDDAVIVMDRPLVSLTTAQKIRQLESSITPRRMRDAALTESGKQWLATIDAQIAALRGT